MSLLLNTQNLKKSFGSQLLFQNLNLSIFKGNRIGLIGPNGAGKSTLLKILADLDSPDSGSVSKRKEVKIGYVSQTQDFPNVTPYEMLIENATSAHNAEKWLTKIGFKGDEKSAATLSGGWKKRLAIALELAGSPDILLIDEPTNHLDLEGVLWLERFLLREISTFLLVSHDRYFLQKLTNRTIEIHSTYPEGLFSIDGTFENFLEKKRLFLEGQRQQERSVASKARRETDWLRQTPKARTSKSQARIDKADEILSQHADLRQRNTKRTAQIQFESSKRQTRKLLVAKNIGFKSLFQNIDIPLSPGTRLGLIGSNGSGKTTLLRLLAGEIMPTQGTIKQADDLKIVYFDQHRAKLPLNLTLREALAPNGDYVYFRGEPIHVNGWCKRFLFSPDSLSMPLEKLSGGERARITIAHLMLQPADILLLDEPTNDLDIPTLETLEENLIDFPGAVVLITHDRYLLENACNTFLSIKSGTFFSDFSQWEKKPRKTPSTKKPPQIKKKAPNSNQLEKQISQLEKKMEDLTQWLPSDQPEKLQAMCKQIAQIEAEIEVLYAKWAEINAL
ncbi:MAG: Energy-dependent translational throttle protein EttA [Chlamydiales bacterium]|nr:Energy-dependent translational throttle protein EttA [Chlamydiales bacterium]